MSLYKQERIELNRAVKELHERGLVQGSNGNVSMRVASSEYPNLFLITPTSIPYHDMTENDFALVDENLEPVEEEKAPSSESYLHMAIYRARKDIAAVVHTHSPYASAVSATGKSIPPILDEMVLYTGGVIETAEYGFPGSEELAVAATRALGDKKAVLMKNHGLCIAGKDLKEAVRIAILAEHIAKVFIFAEMAGGIVELPSESIESERAIYLMRSIV